MVCDHTFVSVKLCIPLQTLARKLHRVQKPIYKHDVCVIRTINHGFANTSLRTISIGFLTNTKDVHSSVGTMFVRSFPDSQDVKALGRLYTFHISRVFFAKHTTKYETLTIHVSHFM